MKVQLLAALCAGFLAAPTANHTRAGYGGNPMQTPQDHSALRECGILDAAENLGLLEQKLEQLGWEVQSNPPSYGIPVTDSQGSTHILHGIALFKTENSRMKYAMAKIDAIASDENDPQILYEQGVRDNLPPPLDESFQLIYVLHLIPPHEVTDLDAAIISSLLQSGSLTEAFDSSTPVRDQSWGRIKLLYRTE